MMIQVSALPEGSVVKYYGQEWTVRGYRGATRELTGITRRGIAYVPPTTMVDLTKPIESAKV